MPGIDLQMTGRWLLAGWLVAIALFRGAPSVDLLVSGLFWRADAGFAVVGNPMWEWLRQRIWDGAIVLFLFAGFAMLRGWARGRAVAGLRAGVWGYLFTLFLLAPGLVVNGWLKAQSGRARPATVTEFGGDKLFTPAGEFAAQCSRNCSFVSGEVSATVVLGLALWLFAALLPRLAGWQRGYLRVVAVFLPGFVVVQRVVTGRHFASDTVFAVLITLSLGWMLWLIFNGQAAALLRRPKRG